MQDGSQESRRGTFPNTGTGEPLSRRLMPRAHERLDSRYDGKVGTTPHGTGLLEPVVIVVDVLGLAAAIAAFIKGDVGVAIYIAAIATAGMAIALVRLRRLCREASRHSTVE
jgi:hypothetical protein